MKQKKWLFLVGAALVVMGAVFLLVVPKPVAGSLESVSTESAPWGNGDEHLRERLAAIKLPALSAEGQALHIHQHLDIFVHGSAVTVPANIGVHETVPAYISPLHVHDNTSIIHVESPTVETFTLGQFFDVWGVRLTATCIGGYCSDDANSLQLYVNGKKYEGDPRTLELAPHQELVLTFGTASEVPSPIPTSYVFPEGY